MSTKATRKSHGNGSFFEAIGLGTSQKVAYSSTSSQSAAVGSSTKLIRVLATTNCHVAVGSNPTATTSTSYYVPSNISTMLICDPSDKIAVIRDAVDGNLFITEAASLA